VCVTAIKPGALGGSTVMGGSNFTMKVRDPGIYDVVAFLQEGDQMRGHFEMPRSETVHVMPGSEAITLVIHRIGSGSIEGRLAPEDGSAPPAKMNVSMGIAEHGRASTWSAASLPLESGCFRLTASAGEYILTLEGAGFGKREIPITVRANERTDLGDIRYEVLPPWTGHVNDPDGQPIAGAYVGDLNSRLEGLERAVKTSADGTFVLPHRPLGALGDFTITAWKEGYAPLAWPSDQLESPMDFKLRRCGDVVVINIPPYEERGGRWVLRADCREPPEIVGRYRPMTYSYFAEKETKEERLERLPVGRWVVHFWKATSLSHGPPPSPQPREYLRFEVEVRAGETTTIDVGAKW
jgi:hypothetical protein